MRNITVFLCLFFLSVAASGQSERAEDRVQVRGVAGWAGFADNSWIHHGVVGAAADARLAAGLRIGPELLYNIGPGRDRDITIMPMVGYEFRRLTRLAPFVSGGAGWLRHKSSASRWVGSYTFGAGGGLKVALSEHYFIAPEVRIGWEPFLRVMVSVGRRF